MNSLFLNENDALQKITELSIKSKVPVLVFADMSSICLTRKLILYLTGIDGERLANNDINEKERESVDKMTVELCNAPLWLNDVEIQTIEQYKSSEECIKEHNIQYVFINSLFSTIEKAEVSDWGKKLGVNIIFTKFE